MAIPRSEQASWRDAEEGVRYPRHLSFFYNPRRGKRTPIGIYMRSLADEIKGGAPGTQEYYRGQMFRDLGNQVQQGDRAAKQGIAQGFGINNPTGLLPALMAQNRLQADYGGANMTAKRMQQQRMREAANEFAAMKQKKWNLYGTQIAPWLQKEMSDERLALQEKIAAASLAGGGGLI